MSDAVDAVFFVIGWLFVLAGTLIGGAGYEFRQRHYWATQWNAGMFFVAGLVVIVCATVGIA